MKKVLMTPPDNIYDYGYEKMTSDFKKLGFDETQRSHLEKVSWVVTEKIHGANFSVHYLDKSLRFAKRKSFLEWGDNFFAFQSIIEKYEDKFYELFEELSVLYDNNGIILFGELFGGAYPHDDVKANPDLSAVQTGVYYTPVIEFCIFDIAIIKIEGSQKHYLDFKDVLQFTKKHALLVVEPLLIGSLTDVLNFDTRINSTVPKLLGLPPLNENLIEGIVVKPFASYDHNLILERPIVKIKNKEFEEGKFHEAANWSYSGTHALIGDDLSFLLDEIRPLVNNNRIESAISKIGDLNIEDTNRLNEIKQEIYSDVYLDFDPNNEFHDLISQNQRDWLTRRIFAEIENGLRNYLK